MIYMLFSVFPGDQLAIAKETGRRLGMGTNMYPSSSLLGQDKDVSIAALPVDELIEKADGFAGVFPGMICVCVYTFLISFPPVVFFFFLLFEQGIVLLQLHQQAAVSEYFNTDPPSLCKHALFSVSIFITKFINFSYVLD